MVSTLAPDFSLLPPDERVLVAISGGADSLALLLALHEKREIGAAHVNHGLRGQESDEDERFVVALCRDLNVPIVTRRVQIALKNGRFSENEARVARYKALRETADATGCSIIATGHTANDVLETVLLNLARGATVSGLAGIAPCRVLDAQVRVVRPILSATRTQTENLCRAANIVWREDSSNANRELKRNRVRHEIVPLLCEVGNKNVDVLARQSWSAAQLWRDDLQYLDEAAKALLHSLEVRTRPNVLTLDGLAFQDLPLSMQRRVLRLAIEEIMGENAPKSEIGSKRIEEIQRRIAAHERRAVWQISSEIFIEWTGVKSGNRIRLWRVERSMSERAKKGDKNAETRPPTLL